MATSAWTTARQQFRSFLSLLPAAFAERSLPFTVADDSGDSVTFAANGRTLELRLIDDVGNVRLSAPDIRLQLSTLRLDTDAVGVVLAAARQRDADVRR